MKKVYSILLGAALMLVGSQAYAQLAVGAGYLNSTDKSIAKGGGDTDTDKMSLDGFYAGATYDIDLSSITDGLSFEPGAFANFGFHKNDNDVKFRDIALQIPLNFKYTYELDGDLNVFGLFGPALQLGLIKKSSYENAGTTTTVDFYDGDGADYNRFNVLLGIGAGIEFGGKFQIRVGYDFGLTNFAKDEVDVLGNTVTVTDKRSGQFKFGVAYVLF